MYISDGSLHLADDEFRKIIAIFFTIYSIIYTIFAFYISVYYILFLILPLVLSIFNDNVLDRRGI